MVSTVAKVLIGGGIVGVAVVALRRRRAQAATLPSPGNPPIGQNRRVPPATVSRTPIAAPVLVPRVPSAIAQASAITQAVLDRAQVDQNGNLLNPQAYINDLANSLAAAGIVLREPVNAAQITQQLATIIQDPRIADMPVVEDNPHLNPPPSSGTTGTVFVPGPESGTDRTVIVFPPGSADTFDITLFPPGSMATFSPVAFGGDGSVVVTLPR